MILDLVVLKNKYAICRYDKGDKLPDWIYASDFYSITKTKDELSVVACQNDSISKNVKCNNDWRIIKILGPLDFSLIGIIADISNILKQEKISLFTISTFDTDYFLVKEKLLDKAINALKNSGHRVQVDE